MADSKKYKVMGDTKGTFLSVEFDLVLEDDTIGHDCNVLGGTFTITQNGKILVLTNPDWCLTLMDITPAPKVVVPSLAINTTLDIYFETKEIAVRCRATYKELYEFLKNEWVMAGALSASPFPLEYDEDLKLLTFKDEWGFEEGSFKFMKEGSYSRLNVAGRNI